MKRRRTLTRSTTSSPSYPQRAVQLARFWGIEGTIRAERLVKGSQLKCWRYTNGRTKWEKEMVRRPFAGAGIHSNILELDMQGNVIAQSMNLCRFRDQDL